VIGKTHFHSGCDSEIRMQHSRNGSRRNAEHRAFRSDKFLLNALVSRESAHRHHHGQVLPFRKRRAYVVEVGVALADFGYNPEMLGGEYLPLGLVNMVIFVVPFYLKAASWGSPTLP
jgi:hypothetical protein